jgi:YbbR domain-containing protein
MTRLIGAIVYNWPLKVMAIALASLLYAALVIAQNAQSRDVSVTIQPTNKPGNTIVIGNLGEVSEIRYFIEDQANVTITSANFSASVDLSGVQPGPEARSIPVTVQSADPRIRVISSTPAFVSVKLERIETKVVPVEVLPGAPPDGIDTEPPVASLTEATVRGAQSDIARVTAVRAAFPIDNSAISIDRDFPLAPVDELGERVREVEVEPATVHVAMKVFKNRTIASVPIDLNIVGSLGPGFEVARVTSSAALVSIQGEAATLADIANARTLPISLDGRTADFDVTVGFDLPAGVTAVTPTQVQVHVFLRAVTLSRTFGAGIVLTGARSDRTYALSVQGGQLTIGGSPVALDRLSGAALTLNANVTGLDIGVHQVTLTITVEAGLSVLAISPATVTVTIGPGAPPASAAPSGGG